MPAAAYIEDKSTRLTVLTSSPLGCSSLSSGKLEVMLDRRLNQDDNLGVGQGVLDNHPTKHIFRILVEKRNSGCQVRSLHCNFFQMQSFQDKSQADEISFNTMKVHLEDECL